MSHKMAGASSVAHRVGRALVVLAAAGALGAAVLLALVWRDHRSPVTLPPPTGPFAVGRVIDAWADEAGRDPLAPSGARREWLAWIWYPTAPTTSGLPADYRPSYWRSAMAREQSWIAALTAHDSAQVRPRSLVGAPVSTVSSGFPVVILRGGLGAPVADYTTLAEDLASHGYVVVGFDAPYRTSLVAFPDGRVVTRPDALNPETVSGPAQVHLAVRLLEAWTADVGLVIDRVVALNAAVGGPFEGRLDLGALAVVGHSLGGATAVQFCHDDSRCRAAVDMDGRPFGSVVTEGMDRAVMLLMSDHSSERDPEGQAVRTDLESMYARLPSSSRRMFVIRGANHFTFSDQMLVRSGTLVGLLEWAGVVRLEPRRGLRIVVEYVRRFLDVHLKGAPAALVTDPDPDFPEVELTTRLAVGEARGAARD